jgi:hypothetical protein
MNSARTTKGWVRIERSVWEHPVLQDDGPMTRCEAWLWLIAHASHAQDDRGSLTVTLGALSREWRWERCRVHRFLTDLVAEEMVEMQVVGHGRNSTTEVRLKRYNAFQAAPQAAERLANDSRTISEHSSARNQTTIAPPANDSRTISEQLPNIQTGSANDSRTISEHSSARNQTTIAPPANDSRTISERLDQNPPHTPPVKQKNNPTSPPSSSDQDHSAQATPPVSPPGGGGGYRGGGRDGLLPVPAVLVEHTSCRDGVVSVKFSHSPSPDVLRELKMAGMSFNREARMWRGPWSQELVEVAKLLFPDANPERWKPAQLLDPTERKPSAPAATNPGPAVAVAPALWPKTRAVIRSVLTSEGYADAVLQALDGATVGVWTNVLLQLQCGSEQSVRLGSEPVRTAMENTMLAIFGKPCRVEVISA